MQHLLCFNETYKHNTIFQNKRSKFPLLETIYSRPGQEQIASGLEHHMLFLSVLLQACRQSHTQ